MQMNDDEQLIKRMFSNNIKVFMFLVVSWLIQEHLPTMRDANTIKVFIFFFKSMVYRCFFCLSDLLDPASFVNWMIIFSENFPF